MKYLITSLAFILFSTPVLACEGYNNAMGALENAIQHSAATTASTKSTNPAPIAAINESIDELEAAIKKHREEERKHARPLLTSEKKL